MQEHHNIEVDDEIFKEISVIVRFNLMKVYQWKKFNLVGCKMKSTKKEWEKLSNSLITFQYSFWRYLLVQKGKWLNWYR